jgi:hypothetical protein
MMVQVNYVAVLVAAIVSMVIGFVWYSPILFAKPWMKEMGYKSSGMKDMQKKMGPMYGLSFLASLLMAYVLTHVIASLANDAVYKLGLSLGLKAAFWSWLGFIMPVQLTDVIFGGKSWKLFLMNTGYQLVSVLGMGVVLGMM